MKDEDGEFIWSSLHIVNGVDMVSETETAPTTRGRTGVAIGILIVTLLTVAFYFYWRTTGMRDETGRRPEPPREISSAPWMLEMSTVHERLQQRGIVRLGRANRAVAGRWTVG